MAYAQGTCNGQIAMLQALESFATACGWTIEYAGVARDNASDRQTMLSHVRQTVTRYYTLVSRTTDTTGPERMVLNQHTGINTANPISTQPGIPSSTIFPMVSIPRTGAMEYFFFGDAQQIACVFRMGLWHQHISFGQLDLLGGYTHGIFVTNTIRFYYLPDTNGNYNVTGHVSYHSSLASDENTSNSGGAVLGGTLRLANGSFAWGAKTIGHSDLYVVGSVGPLRTVLPALASSLYFPKSTAQNAAAILTPIAIYGGHPSQASKVQLAGTVHDIYHVNMIGQFSGKEILIGSTTYTLFPWFNMTLDASFKPAAGLAYKKVI